ncbi:MAG: hypothetical protein M1833_006825 [Piccolia ochrophora]|nr:MAG: hypothetical protein M1833_006825 [Piccolia ochrophora]
MSKRIYFKVHGEVQGVFFRAFTEEKATSYGLTGWVKNSSDGSVEGEAQGDESSIEKLLKDVNKGPSAARVSKVDTSEREVKSGESSFSQ